MKKQVILEELQMVLKGKTLDALLPGLMYAILVQFFSIAIAVTASILLAFTLILYRYKQGSKKRYAFGGVILVALTGGYAILTQNAKSYFLITTLSSGVLPLVTLFSLFLPLPIAAILSHLSRGWPTEWYKRKDVRPAYFEVSAIWLCLLFIRFIIKLTLYLSATPLIIALSGIILGWPLNVLVLIASYLYGLFRLNALKGPSVMEFKEKKPQPWQGQRRGF